MSRKTKLYYNLSKGETLWATSEWVTNGHWAVKRPFVLDGTFVMKPKLQALIEAGVMYKAWGTVVETDVQLPDVAKAVEIRGSLAPVEITALVHIPLDANDAGTRLCWIGEPDADPAVGASWVAIAEHYIPILSACSTLRASTATTGPWGSPVYGWVLPWEVHSSTDPDLVVMPLNKQSTAFIRDLLQKIAGQFESSNWGEEEEEK
jgi:hypothetical protein